MKRPRSKREVRYPTNGATVRKYEQKIKELKKENNELMEEGEQWELERRNVTMSIDTERRRFKEEKDALVSMQTTLMQVICQLSELLQQQRER
jgi:uncharacterized membrane protein (DUF106 family)